MTFQFQCPRGHLLEGDPSQAGQQCHCPMCGMLFIIPEPLPQHGPPSPPTGPSTSSTPPSTNPSEPSAYYPTSPVAPAAPFFDGSGFAATETGGQVPEAASRHASAVSSDQAASVPIVGVQFPPSAESAPGAVADSPGFSSEPSGEPELLHIPCPNGHELETPRDMLNQEVMCPFCNAQFRLREKDSVEFQRRRREELDRKERKRGMAWFNWAIVAAVLVVLGLLFLIFSSS